MVVIDGGNTDSMLAVSAAAGLMQIHHHGAIDGVTGSCHELVLADGRSLLIDRSLSLVAVSGR